jgi:hypothetical protein
MVSFVSGPGTLPLLKTVACAYRVVFGNLGFLIRISWLWLVIVLPVYSATNWFAGPWINALMEPELVGAWRPLEAFLVSMYMLGGTLILLPFVASIAVAWHRFLLCGERTANRTYLTLDNVVWGYFRAFAVLYLGWLIPLISLVAFVVVDPPISWEMPWIAIVILLFFALWAVAQIAATIIFIRLCLILPGRALKEPPLNWRDAWQASGSNFWRFAIGVLLVVGPG